MNFINAFDASFTVQTHAARLIPSLDPKMRS